MVTNKEDEDLNTVESSYMLSLKIPYLDCSKEDFCLSSTAPARKFNKINSPKSKSKNQLQKKRTHLK